MRRLMFAVAFCLLCVSHAHAQTDPVAVSYDLNVYVSGATVPSTRVVPASVVICDLATAPVGDSVNPAIWWWQNPAKPTTWCKTDDTARLAALPVGSYTGAVIGVNAAGTRGPESPRVPFSRTAVPLPDQGPPAVINHRFSK